MARCTSDESPTSVRRGGEGILGTWWSIGLLFWTRQTASDVGRIPQQAHACCSSKTSLGVFVLRIYKKICNDKLYHINTITIRYDPGRAYITPEIPFLSSINKRLVLYPSSCLCTRVLCLGTWKVVLGRGKSARWTDMLSRSGGTAVPYLGVCGRCGRSCRMRCVLYGNVYYVDV